MLLLMAVPGWVDGDLKDVASALNDGTYAGAILALDGVRDDANPFSEFGLREPEPPPHVDLFPLDDESRVRLRKAWASTVQRLRRAKSPRQEEIALRALFPARTRAWW